MCKEKKIRFSFINCWVSDFKRKKWLFILFKMGHRDREFFVCIFNFFFLWWKQEV